MIDPTIAGLIFETTACTKPCAIVQAIGQQKVSMTFFTD
ncbi:MAG: hypothetical protein JWR15_1069 [Prosthecobacter sp.]|nr:hypothetical protein [Prosthecobacter sp.]